MTTFTPRDEARIHQLIAEQAQVICDKKLDQILANYAPGIVLFDRLTWIKHYAKSHSLSVV